MDGSELRGVLGGAGGVQGFCGDVNIGALLLKVGFWGTVYSKCGGPYIIAIYWAFKDI